MNYLEEKTDIAKYLKNKGNLATNQMLMRVLLEDLGLKIVMANDGVKGVQAYDSQEFSLILMDENMPNMNGIEATKQIRMIEAVTQLRVPIIAVTANALVEDKKRFLAADMDDYIAKPIETKELERVLSKYLPIHPLDPSLKS